MIYLSVKNKNIVISLAFICYLQLNGCGAIIPVIITPPPTITTKNIENVTSNSMKLLRGAYYGNYGYANQSLCWFFECTPSYTQNSGQFRFKVQLFKPDGWGSCFVGRDESVLIQIKDGINTIFSESIKNGINLTTKDFIYDSTEFVANLPSNNKAYKLEVTVYVYNGMNVTPTTAWAMIPVGTSLSQKTLIVNYYKQRLKSNGSIVDVINYSQQTFNFIQKFSNTGINVQITQGRLNTGKLYIETLVGSDEWIKSGATNNLQSALNQVEDVGDNEIQLFSLTDLLLQPPSGGTKYSTGLLGLTYSSERQCFIFYDMCVNVGYRYNQPNPQYAAGRTIAHELGHAVLKNATPENMTAEISDHTSHFFVSDECILFRHEYYSVPRSNRLYNPPLTQGFCEYHKFLMNFIFPF